MITIDGYPLDLVEEERHALESEITDYPVEDGSDATDNVRLRPRTLTLTNAVVSNTPIGQVATDPTRILLDAEVAPSQDAFRRIEKLWLSRQPFTLVSNLKKYEKMLIESVEVVQTAKDHGGLVFSAKLKEVRIVKNKRATVAVPNAGGEGNLGLRAGQRDKNGILVLDSAREALWRKGNPPGASPNFTIVGVFGPIVGQEVVKQVLDPKTHVVTITHKSGVVLSEAEHAAFYKDWERDARFRNSYQKPAALESYSAEQDKVLKRAQDMSDYKDAHPGEKVNPEQFGLVKDKKGLWRAK